MRVRLSISVLNNNYCFSIIPLDWPNAAAYVLEWRFSFDRIAEIWWSTVFGEINNLPAISEFDNALVNNFKTSICRPVKPAGFSFVDCLGPFGIFVIPRSLICCLMRLTVSVAPNDSRMVNAFILLSSFPSAGAIALSEG